MTNLSLNESTGSSTATLPHIEEEPEISLLYRLIHIRVGENDVGTLSTEFQSDLLQITVSSGFHDQTADFCRTGEGDFVNVRMRGNGLAGGWTKSGDDVHYSRRETSLNLADIQFHQIICIFVKIPLRPCTEPCTASARP